MPTRQRSAFLYTCHFPHLQEALSESEHFSILWLWDKSWLCWLSAESQPVSVLARSVNVSVISSIHNGVACKQACVVNRPLWSASQRLTWWRLVVHKDSSAARHQTEWLSPCLRDAWPTAGRNRNDPWQKQGRIKKYMRMKMIIVVQGWLEEVGYWCCCNGNVAAAWSFSPLHSERRRAEGGQEG